MGIKAKFQLLLSGHSCGAISRSGDYQYKGSGGRSSIPGWKLVGGPKHWLGTALVPPLTHSLFDNTECPRFTGHVGRMPRWSGFFFFFFFFSKCKSLFFHFRSCTSAFLIFLKSFLKLRQCIFKIILEVGPVNFFNLIHSRSSQVLIMFMSILTKTGHSHRLYAITHVL